MAVRLPVVQKRGLQQTGFAVLAVQTLIHQLVESFQNQMKVLHLALLQQVSRNSPGKATTVADKPLSPQECGTAEGQQAEYQPGAPNPNP